MDIYTKNGWIFALQQAANALEADIPPQGAAVADAADSTEVVAQFNALLASLRAAGVIATEVAP